MKIFNVLFSLFNIKIKQNFFLTIQIIYNTKSITFSIKSRDPELFINTKSLTFSYKIEYFPNPGIPGFRDKEKVKLFDLIFGLKKSKIEKFKILKLITLQD